MLLRTSPLNQHLTALGIKEIEHGYIDSNLTNLTINFANSHTTPPTMIICEPDNLTSRYVTHGNATNTSFDAITYGYRTTEVIYRATTPFYWVAIWFN